MADPQYPPSRRERERAADRIERPDDSRSGDIYGVAGQSVPEADRSNPREVRFEDKAGNGSRGGTPHLSAITTTASCDCDDIDIDMTYRMCCLTVGDSPSYKAATLFDTGAHASFVNSSRVGRGAGKKESELPAEGTRGARPALHYGVTGGDGVQQPDIRMCSLRFNFL